MQEPCKSDTPGAVPTEGVFVVQRGKFIVSRHYHLRESYRVDMFEYGLLESSVVWLSDRDELWSIDHLAKRKKCIRGTNASISAEKDEFSGADEGAVSAWSLIPSQEIDGRMCTVHQNNCLDGSTQLVYVDSVTGVLRRRETKSSDGTSLQASDWIIESDSVDDESVFDVTQWPWK